MLPVGDEAEVGAKLARRSVGDINDFLEKLCIEEDQATRKAVPVKLVKPQEADDEVYQRQEEALRLYLRKKPVLKEEKETKKVITGHANAVEEIVKETKTTSLSAENARENKATPKPMNLNRLRPLYENVLKIKITTTRRTNMDAPKTN